MDWYAGKIPLIELAAYYGWLPPESQTRTAQAGDREDRRWGDTEWMQAAQITYLQAIVRLLWIGQRIQGDVPRMTPPQGPKFARDHAADEKALARKSAYQAEVARLRQYSPSYQQPAE